jgi:hypothetical protein
MLHAIKREGDVLGVSSWRLWWESKGKMAQSGPELSNPLRKFKLVFLGEQSGKIF